MEQSVKKVENIYDSTKIRKNKYNSVILVVPKCMYEQLNQSIKLSTLTALSKKTSEVKQQPPIEWRNTSKNMQLLMLRRISLYVIALDHKLVKDHMAQLQNLEIGIVRSQVRILPAALVIVKSDFSHINPQVSHWPCVSIQYTLTGQDTCVVLHPLPQCGDI